MNENRPMGILAGIGSCLALAAPAGPSAPATAGPPGTAVARGDGAERTSREQQVRNRPRSAFDRRPRDGGRAFP